MFKPVDPHPNFPKLEEEILRFWEENKIFEKSLEKTKDGEPFTFYDGPPFATGLPHYGHILASTIKDLVPRYQTMKGRFVRRRWGWDCHGLPIEELVERKLGISGKKQIEEIGIAKFNETCRSMVLQYAEEWGKMVRRIARWVEFENSYKTMDRDYMESVWWAFKEIYRKGLVYEGRKALLYCPRCETPISNFEVAMDNSYQVVTEEAVTINFKVKTTPTSSPPILRSKTGGEREGVYLLAWTTTPWTLIGNIALAVGKDIDYVKVSTPSSSPPYQGGEREGVYYIVAKDRVSDIIPGGEVVEEFKGKDLVGLEYEPLYQIPEMKSPKSYHVYAADFVNTEEGTGVVHTAVVYGEEDYELGIKEGLPVVPLLDEKGKFNEKAPDLVRGLYFKEAERTIKGDLEKRGLLFSREMHEHSYPHCWRCGTMLFYNAIPAWFINIAKIKNQILQSNEKEINWYPEHLKFGRYAKSVESAPDWNISRNRYWGNPIPVWRCLECKKDTVIGSIEELKKKAINGIKPLLMRRGRGGHSDSMTPSSSPSRGGREDELDLHRPYIDEVIIKCDHCGGEARRITEIFDSWVEAGSMPFSEYHYPFENKEVFESRFPAQFVAEYIAQTRTWFYVMHVISLVLFGKAPFENVVTTGNVLNDKGEKLSKSKRNYPDPWEVIDKYGVDSIRFYLMNSVVMQSDDLFFNTRDLEIIYRKVTLILWNVYSYFVTYANENKFKVEISKIKTTIQNSRFILDRWILARLQGLINEATRQMDSYETVKTTREIELFINDLSTWYLRRSRGRSDDEFFATLYRCLIRLAKVMAPVAPYISEIIYKDLRDKTHAESVHLADWPEIRELTDQEKTLLNQMDKLRNIVEQAHALRAKAGIKLRQPLRKLKVESEKLKVELEEILKEEVNVKEIEYGDKVELDTQIDEELKIEGMTRELERRINEFRKESGLKIGEQAELYYQTESAMIEKALLKVDKKKTYLDTLRQAQGENQDFQKEVEINNEKLWLAIKNIRG